MGNTEFAIAASYLAVAFHAPSKEFIATSEPVLTPVVYLKRYAPLVEPRLMAKPKG
jgi:hypothetical protein